MELKSSLTPLPEVSSFDYSTATAEAVVNALKLSGGVLIHGLLKPSEVEQIERDARPWLEKDKPWNGEKGNLSPYMIFMLIVKIGDFFPPETRRAFGMMGKSRTFAEAIVGNRLWVEVCDELLTSRLEKNWVCFPVLHLAGSCLMCLFAEFLVPGRR